MRALARNTDPITSHLAAERVCEFSVAHRDMILTALQYYGPQTAHEIAQHVNLLTHQVLKRLPELYKQGLIAPTGQKRAALSGRAQRVWRVV